MSNGSTTWSYTYDANGMRTSRSNGSTTYTYVYNGSQLTQMTKGSDTLYFTYGALGPTTVTWNGTTYYYALNAQGDVIGILDGGGNGVVLYNWDNAWGYHPQPEGPMADTLGTLNPLRYRSYVYDEETGLYYLQSRYYNPEICRFINADAYASTGQGFIGNNMFAYCLNNPVNAIDPSGEDAIWLQDMNAVYNAGHTGLLIQDAKGKWHHFYWGNNGTGKFNKEGAKAKLELLSGFTYTNFDNLKNYLKNHKTYNGSYEGYIYFKGDFSAGQQYADTLQRNYNLIWDNCMQMSVDVLLKGRFEKSNASYKAFLRSIRANPIPNVAYTRLRNFHTSVVLYHAAPWYLRWACVNPVKAVLIY